MLRNIVRINEDLCDGCGQCAIKCAEGALQIVDGKARLMSEIYCDGLGACIGECPRGAITIEQREAPAFNSEARSELTHWPVQLTLVPEYAPFLRGADILVCADCVPFALPDFHAGYLKNRAVLVGCPKLDDLGFYREKLLDIFRTTRPASLTVLRMEVPCCGGIARAVVNARDEAVPELPVDIVTVGIGGSATRERVLPLRGQVECNEKCTGVPATAPANYRK